MYAYRSISKYGDLHDGELDIADLEEIMSSFKGSAYGRDPLDEEEIM
jgi:hypothetical protein